MADDILSSGAFGTVPAPGDPFAGAQASAATSAMPSAAPATAPTIVPANGDPFAAGSSYQEPMTAAQVGPVSDETRANLATANSQLVDRLGQTTWGKILTGIPASIYDAAVALPRDVQTGRINVMDPSSISGSDALRIMSAAAMGTGGGAAAPELAPGEVALGAGPIKQPAALPQGLNEVLKYLSPEEAATVKARNADALMSAFTSLPSAEEMAATAYAGRAKRGWYQRSQQALVDTFGAEDAPRFARLMAALSPQTSVESNATNAIHTWINWDLAGRPTDRDAIIKILGQSVQGGKGVESVLPAWINNSVTALGEDAGVPLSGPKVHSFGGNLSGDPNAVTNDAWMANWSGLNQDLFKKTGQSPGFGPGYNAMSAKTRQAAEMLSNLTGETWDPREVQETVWSLAKTLYEKARGAGTTAVDVLPQLTHAEIAGTPDFAQLFAQPDYMQALRRGGYGTGSEVAGAEGAGAAGAPAGGQPAYGAYAPEGSVASAQGSPFEAGAFSGHLNAVAQRLDALMQSRAAAKAATIAGKGAKAAVEEGTI